MERMLKSRSRFELPGPKDTEREYVTRTFKSFRFEAHSRRKVIIITGEIAISVTGVVCGQLMDENKQEFKKLIKLEGLSNDTNIRIVIDEILDQCPFISEDFIPKLADVLEILKNRKYDRHGLAVVSNDGENRSIPLFPEYFEDESTSVFSEADMKEIKMDSLDLYVELLYEELEDKVKGAQSIWKLSTSYENLVIIFNHDTAMNAVFRTLREDYRKSIELTTNLLNLILAFTKFHDFHPILTTNKICSVTLDIIEFELSRYEKWVDELYRRKELVDNEETVTPRNKADFEKLHSKFAELTRKQDQLLAVAFDVVKHLSEAPSFAKEVHNRGVCRLLMLTLDRTNVKLLTVSISFLVNMSGYAEAIREMHEMRVVQQTVRLMDIGIPHELLRHVVFLYYNLSFNTKLRLKMVRLGVVNKLAQISDDVELGGICIMTMYNISIDHKVRPKFVTADIIPKLMAKVLGPIDSGYMIETGALLLNLAASKRCTQDICGNNKLPRLVKVAMQRQDPLLVKIIRRVSGHVGPTKSLFTELITNIVSAVREKSNPEFVVECLGTLSNLGMPDVDFCALLQGYQLLNYIRSVLSRPLPRIRVHGNDARSIQESMLLEVIVFLGTCGSEPSCADFLIEEGILDTLHHIGRAPALDTDVRLQLLYALYRLCSHTKSRNYIIEKTKIPDLIHSFIRSECAELREVAQAIWSVFGDHNAEWQNKVQNERFLAHNGDWIDVISQSEQISMDKAALAQFNTRINAEKTLRQKNFLKPNMRKRASAKTSSESFDDSDEESDNSEEDYDDDDEEVEGNDRRSRGRFSAQSDYIEESEPDQSRRRSIFDQFKHQFNQEMVSRIYGTANSEEEDDDDDAIPSRGGSDTPNSSSRYTTRSGSLSRPQTSKSRPSTAHHSGRRSTASAGVIGGAVTSPEGGLPRNMSASGFPSRMSSSSSSFESQGFSEAHPSKTMKPPIIVNIKPKESW